MSNVFRGFFGTPQPQQQPAPRPLPLASDVPSTEGDTEQRDPSQERRAGRRITRRPSLLSASRPGLKSLLGE